MDKRGYNAFQGVCTSIDITVFRCNHMEKYSYIDKRGYIQIVWTFLDVVQVCKGVSPLFSIGYKLFSIGYKILTKCFVAVMEVSLTREGKGREGRVRG